MSAAQIFAEHLMDLIDESPTQALSIITGAFVSLAINAVDSLGGDSSKDIRIDAGENRDITIHALIQENGIGNARLTDAAPDLYEACLKAEELLSPFQDSGLLGDKALINVRAALAKVRGDK